MNIAYQALVLFIYILPGITFRRGMSTAGQFRQQRSLPDELASSVLYAALAHVVWIPVCNLLPGPDVDLDAALMHAAGQYGKESKDLAVAFGSLTHHLPAVVGYFLSLNAAAFGVGWLIREGRERDWRGLQAIGWLEDEPNAERFREWSNVLVDREQDALVIPLLATIVQIGSDPYLFVGILEKVHFGADGNPDRFVLSDVIRRPLKSDRDDNDDNDRFYEILGNSFIIRASEAKTLNILIRYVTDGVTSEAE